VNTKAKLEQCQADIATLEAERDGLQKELEKPKLRHGDYGYDFEGDPCMSLQLHNGAGCTLHRSCAGKKYAYTCKTLNACYVPKVVLGNIFDDLERNSKDLEKFEVKSTHFHGKFKRKLEFIMVRPHETGCVNIYGENSKDYGTFEREDIIEIYQKLGQLIATAKRRQNAK